MPYVWIRRNADTDEWEGELGDSIKLGIEEGLLIEKDPIRMLNLEDALAEGIVQIFDDGRGKVVKVNQEPVAPKPKQNKKLSNEEKLVTAKNMKNRARNEEIEYMSEEDKTYSVFTRTWWKENPDWPNGLEPSPGEKTYLEIGVSFSEARNICREYNSENEPGRYSLKAEFEED